jgi:uncharacterized protein YndB with AHSA1/START domain
MTDRTAVADGELQQVGELWRLRFVRRLPHPPEKVWRALTDSDELDAWFPDTIEGERALGATWRFVSKMPGVEPYEGTVTAFDPGTALEFTWGDDVVRFDLAADGLGTVLTFTDTFAEGGKASRDGAGWHECLDLLRHQLDGDERGWVLGQRWAEVHPQYVERFGPEASVLGPPEGWEPPVS